MSGDRYAPASRLEDRQTFCRYAGLRRTCKCAMPAGPVSAQAVVDSALLAGMKYRSIGPARGGRVTAVAGGRGIGI